MTGQTVIESLKGAEPFGLIPPLMDFSPEK